MSKDSKAAIEGKWKEKFEYWLTNNMYINKSTADLIIRHVEHYFPHSPVQGIVSEDQIIKILEGEDSHRFMAKDIIELFKKWHNKLSVQGISKEGWISVEDVLPELNEPLMGYEDDGITRRVMIENFKATVLAFDPEIGIFKAELNKRGWSEIGKSYTNGTVKPTHWMPLPAPPGASSPSSSKGEDKVFTALQKAVEVIRGWHNMGSPSGRLTKEQIDLAWKIYYENAPEMKIIREALNQ